MGGNLHSPTYFIAPRTDLSFHHRTLNLAETLRANWHEDGTISVLVISKQINYSFTKDVLELSNQSFWVMDHHLD